MPNAAVDVQAIITSNPRTSPELLQRTEKLVQRMSRLGIEKTGYRLASPFSSSLKSISKGKHKEESSQSKE